MNRTIFDADIKEIVLPTILKQILKLLLELLQIIFAVFTLTRSQTDHYQLFTVMLARLLKQFQDLKRRRSQLPVVEQSYSRIEMVTKIERVFDLVPDIGRFVVVYEPT